METSTMFESASRLKLRFDSPRGAITVEDLWDLPLSAPTANRASLDAIAMGLQRDLRDTAEITSFVSPTKVDAGRAGLELMLEIVKYVISVRLAERDAKKAAEDRGKKKERILELIAQKQDAALAGQSVDELMALANSL